MFCICKFIWGSFNADLTEALFRRYTTELKFILAYNFAGQVTKLLVMAGPTIKTWHLMMMI
jgi:hypothetical protein